MSSTMGLRLSGQIVVQEVGLLAWNRPEKYTLLSLAQGGLLDRRNPTVLIRAIPRMPLHLFVPGNYSKSQSHRTDQGNSEHYPIDGQIYENQMEASQSHRTDQGNSKKT